MSYHPPVLGQEAAKKVSWLAPIFGTHRDTSKADILIQSIFMGVLTAGALALITYVVGFTNPCVYWAVGAVGGAVAAVVSYVSLSNAQKAAEEW